MRQIQPQEIVRETAKALLVQVWTGASANPEESAREYWIPKSQCETETRNGRAYVSRVAVWWLSRNKLWNHV